VPGRAYLRIKSDSVVHDSVSIVDLDREEIIQKYERANGLSIAALILLLTSPFTFGLGFILSLFLQLLPYASISNTRIQALKKGI